MHATWMADKLLTWNQVDDLTPFSRVHLWRLIKAGQFPAPLQVGKRRVAFRESEINAWLDAKPRAEWTLGAEG